MKTVTFTNRDDIAGYGCSEPGDQSGEYVPASTVELLMTLCDDIVDSATRYMPANRVRPETLEALIALLDEIKGE